MHGLDHGAAESNILLPSINGGEEAVGSIGYFFFLSGFQFLTFGIWEALFDTPWGIHGDDETRTP